MRRETHEKQLTFFQTDADPHRFQLRWYQQEAVDAMMAALLENDRHPACIAATGAGKCLGKDTPVLLYSGEVVPVQDVQIGDLLMGPDSGPRTVLSLARGRENLYCVHQTNGDDYVVNESHILSLRVDGPAACEGPAASTGPAPRKGLAPGMGHVVNISVLDYLRRDAVFRGLASGWRKTPSDIVLTTICLEPIGEGEYYGFEIAGPDRLFLLGDFTVTHNTVIMGAFIERYLQENPQESVLVLAHRAELITQAAERFSHILPNDLVPAIHCASLGKKEFGKVTVASVQTIGKPDVLGAMPAPGLVIVDEAHRIPTEGNGQYQRLIKALSARHRDMRVGGFTATPWRLDGGHIVGPDNPLNYTAYQIEPATLMDEKFLVKPQWEKTLYPIETGKARSRKGDFLNEDLRNAATIQHKERMQDVLTRTADCQHNIVFTIDRKHARLVAQSLPDSVVIDGSMSKDSRDQRLQDFSDGKYRYLVNVDLFIEGFDLPKIDSVTVLRPTQSAARWIQMVGRGLRTDDRKTVCRVLDYGGNLERFPMRPDEPGFFNYNPRGEGNNVPGTLVKNPNTSEFPVELPPPLTMNVVRVDASVFHSNHKDRDFLKIRYFIGMTSVDQTWVVPSKDFADFWGRHGFGDAPKNPMEAMNRVREGDLLVPRAVSMRYRANLNKPFGFSEIVSEVHSWTETMKNRHIFFSIPLHEAGEPSGYTPETPGFIRPTPIYGQKIYADLVNQNIVPTSGQWVTAYPTQDGQPVRFKQPIMLYNNQTGMSFVAEKSELDQLLRHKMVFRPVIVTGGPAASSQYAGVSDRQVSLLAPHEAGNMGFLCAQKKLWDGARYWWEKAAGQGDVAAQKNLRLLDECQRVSSLQGVSTPSISVVQHTETPQVVFAYGGRRP
ncbi:MULTISPECIES: DEAD/DEAH box helicase [Acidithiobacillus]|uniref:Restriction endonuclease subunit R n=2 Tax=Acidithiobacillus TaxID=119977 RepID=A0A1C2ID25_ACITH|nr:MULTISPECIES: DEAD/DEAH box helicase [Acidithiobacillus]MBU2843298.1 DEAD/DEAH box helicase family protein [Acidithiobacillus thiooxidans]OCX70987.1 hypothetical protein A6M23_12870 [Acidithiobacillus thiooxidans]OCX73894.1 hypothetical protein A6P07_07125 [Acidithiobacillus thiooxidans]OCX78893.1 hypothetical protein A6O24_03260 [Acidithiobacillus thiooxidans]OCX82109.1 hypothetical protein A6O26_10920 [Acidithiobacillus thiooxidans]